MAGNSDLRKAKAAMKDEFYTQLSDIENELRHSHIFLWTLFIKYCYTTKFHFSLQKDFDWYCDYFLADCFICE